MSFLTQHIEQLIALASEKQGKAKTRILMDAGVVPGQYFNSASGKKPWPVSVLTSLGDSGMLGITTDELLALKALEEYSPSVIVQAHKTLLAKGLVEPLPDTNLYQGQAKPPQQATEEGGQGLAGS